MWQELTEFWTIIDTWIVVIGVLCSLSCALLGNFLVLRRMSMMGDAISHAVLPGIAGGFLLVVALQSSDALRETSPTWSEWLNRYDPRNPLVMLVGAMIAGVLTTLFTQWVQNFGKVDRGAAMGVVFTFLFAVGLLLLAQASRHVDLDLDCVLYGTLEMSYGDTYEVFGHFIPRAALNLGGVLLINVVAVALFYKELKISSFDPALATTLGINARFMHYLLMVLVAVTTVASFEAIGSILVIAMLIVPAATAHLLTDRLWSMIAVSLVVAVLAAVGGHITAITVPSMIFEGVEDTQTAGMMAVVAGALFFVAMLLAPRHGVISRAVHRMALSLRILREDLLGLLYRMEELGVGEHTAAAPAMLRQGLGVTRISSALTLWSLRLSKWVRRTPSGYGLTDAGRSRAQNLVRAHRLWETFLYHHLPVAAEQLHDKAERLEHITTPAMADQLAEDLADERGEPTHDPHGRDIPGS